MQMVPILDELLIHGIGFHSLRTEAAGQQLDKVVLKLRREVGDMTAGVLSDDEHLTKVGF